VLTAPLQVLCQHGRARSVAGAAKLRAAGVADVKARAAPPSCCRLSRVLTPVALQVLEGGIEAYSAVDPSVPKYPKYTPNFKF
jgi:rhodanese-related sulfurtransferase